MQVLYIQVLRCINSAEIIRYLWILPLITTAELTAVQFKRKLFKSLQSGMHNNNKLNTLFFPTTTAVAVHLSVSTHSASRTTWQQSPLWMCNVPSSPFHRLSICSFTLSLVFHLYFIYFTHQHHQLLLSIQLRPKAMKWPQSEPLCFNYLCSNGF